MTTCMYASVIYWCETFEGFIGHVVMDLGLWLIQAIILPIIIEMFTMYSLTHLCSYMCKM